MGTCLEQYVETCGNYLEKHGQIWKVSGTRGKYVNNKNYKVCGAYVEDGTCIDIEYSYRFIGLVQHEKGTNFLFF